MRRLLLGSIIITIISSSAAAQDIRCVLKHSAVAQLNENENVDVHTTSNDNIAVEITGIGEKEATFNGVYTLVLIKRDPDALYYLQSTSFGLTLWVYFAKTRTITYCKLRAFPVSELPDSYLIIAKC